MAKNFFKLNIVYIILMDVFVKINFIWFSIRVVGGTF